MTPSIKLSGNLGERHRCFNYLVRDAHLQRTPLSVQTHPDEPAINQLFKIDLASKQKNVDYIIHTLKDEDMLYVSRALKSLWLLDADHSKIINPNFLEIQLFPQMITTAVNKMRHWINMHLRDPQRCTEFYQFYKDKNFDVAAKFLCHCSTEFILGEISNILEKITPKLLKRLSEIVPQTTKIYYDNLKHNQELLKYYLENDSAFFANVKYLLKLDADVFFYVLENFFVHEKFSALNAVITKHIMKHHKSRFLCKPELYTTWFLEIKTLAKYLSAEEIKDLVSKLARADYLDFWFSYQNVEPLIKRIDNDERKAFKKLIFVDKAFGSSVKEWPYPIPTPPKLETPQTSLFNDIEIVNPYYYNSFMGAACLRSAPCGMPLRRRCLKGSCVRTQTLLDQLFDKYRFSNYKQTYNELQKQLKAENSPQNRQYMLLVLVSKTGGRTEDLVSFMDLIAQFKNEPVHIRAAIIRSLVKRAFVWRLPSEHWTRILEWGHGLGLDGSTPEAECREGLHAVVIRDLLSNIKPRQAVWEKFLADFDTLKEYSFTAAERSHVSVRLPKFLLQDAQSGQQKPKLSQLQHLLNTLEAYNMRFDYFPGTVDAVASAVNYFWNSADEELRTGTECLLRRIYDAGVARKRLIKEYFEINHTDASYVNALRHDTSILENTGKWDKLINDKDLKHEKFFQKLALYFMEKDGLGERYRAVLQHRAVTMPEKAISKSEGCFSESGTKPRQQILARPMTLLSGSTFPSLLETFDAAPPRTEKRQFAAALRANAHLARPTIDLKSMGWRKAGAKAVANHVVTCKECDVEEYLVETVSWRRTLRLALALAKRVNKEREVFKVLASERPGAALKAALRYFCREGNKSDLSIWEMVKTRIYIADPRQLRTYVKLSESVPETIKAEYCFLVYLACKQRTPDLERWAFSKIPSVLAELDEQYIFDANETFWRDYFTVCSADYITDARHFNTKRTYTGLYVQIIAKFLVLSTTQEMLEKRLNKIGIPFLKRLELFWKEASPRNAHDQEFLNIFLIHLRYNKAYFNPKCVSCLPVFETITEWMHGFLSIEKWFETYVSVHLTMIYYKTVRHCIKQNPELFSEESKKLEGANMLGTIFGKFISNEVEELNQKYFPTITEIYAADFVKYFSQNFCRFFDESVANFTMAVLKELLANKSVALCLLAKYAFEELRNQLKEEHVKDILNKFKESGIEELRFAHDFD